jgi:hypothetical protein
MKVVIGLLALSVGVAHAQTTNPQSTNFGVVSSTGLEGKGTVINPLVTKFDTLQQFPNIPGGAFVLLTDSAHPRGILVPASAFSQPEVFRSNGTLSGAAGVGFKVGIDYSSGTQYYVNSSGNWTAFPPGTTVVLNELPSGKLNINAGTGGVRDALLSIDRLPPLVGAIDPANDRIPLWDVSGNTNAYTSVNAIKATTTNTLVLSGTNLVSTVNGIPATATIPAPVDAWRGSTYPGSTLPSTPTEEIARQGQVSIVLNKSGALATAGSTGGNALFVQNTNGGTSTLSAITGYTVNSGNALGVYGQVGSYDGTNWSGLRANSNVGLQPAIKAVNQQGSTGLAYLGQGAFSNTGNFDSLGIPTFSIAASGINTHFVVKGQSGTRSSFNQYPGNYSPTIITQSEGSTRALALGQLDDAQTNLMGARITAISNAGNLGLDIHCNATPTTTQGVNCLNIKSVGLGLGIPSGQSATTKLDIDTGVANDSGLRLRQTKFGTSLAQASNLALGVDLNGKVAVASTIGSADTRATNPQPQSYNTGTTFEFKQCNSIGVPANAVSNSTYCGLSTDRPYGLGSDFSGGQVCRVATAIQGSVGTKLAQCSLDSINWGPWSILPSSSSQIPNFYSKLQNTLTGGGIVEYTNDRYLKWSARFLALGAGTSVNTGTLDILTSGYVDITMPPVGTAIVAVGGNVANAVSAAKGIPLPAWGCLYYDVATQTSNTGVFGNFKIHGYGTNEQIKVPASYILIGCTNDDNKSLKLATGAVLYNSLGGLNTDPVLSFEQNKQDLVLTSMKNSISGGGNKSFDGTSVSWNTRFIAIGYGTSSLSTDGYFNIDLPPIGTVVPGIGTGNTSVTATGIQLNVWECLYYILPLGSSNGSLQTNFRKLAYSTGFLLPKHWVPVACRNGDLDSTFIKWADGSISGKSSLETLGSFGANIRLVSAAYTVANDDFTIVATGSISFPITLGPPVNRKILNIKNNSASSISIVGSIDGVSTTIYIPAQSSRTFHSSTTTWYLI